MSHSAAVAYGLSVVTNSLSVSPHLFCKWVEKDVVILNMLRIDPFFHIMVAKYVMI